MARLGGGGDKRQYPPNSFKAAKMYSQNRFEGKKLNFKRLISIKKEKISVLFWCPGLQL